MAQWGRQDLYAMDLSWGVLGEARRKDLYKEFRQMALGEELSFETNSFDAVTSAGAFTTGHATVHAFDELARITKPSRSIVFSLRVNLYEGGGFAVSKEYQSGLGKPVSGSQAGRSPEAHNSPPTRRLR